MERIRPIFVFLFGTRRAALTSVLCLLVLIAICFPPVIGWMFNRILDAVGPVVYALARVAIVIGVIMLGFQMNFGRVKWPRVKEKKDG